VRSALPWEERDQVRLPTELVARIDTLDADLRGGMAAGANEAARQDVCIDVVRGIEKQRWMLQAHLAGQRSGDGPEP
jgi:DNA-binding ferritin-like protein